MPDPSHVGVLKRDICVTSLSCPKWIQLERECPIQLLHYSKTNKKPILYEALKTKLSYLSDGRTSNLTID